MEYTFELPKELDCKKKAKIEMQKLIREMSEHDNILVLSQKFQEAGVYGSGSNMFGAYYTPYIVGIYIKMRDKGMTSKYLSYRYDNILSHMMSPLRSGDLEELYKNVKNREEKKEDSVKTIKVETTEDTKTLNKLRAAIKQDLPCEVLLEQVRHILGGD